jgi:plastocyanin
MTWIKAAAVATAAMMVVGQGSAGAEDAVETVVTLKGQVFTPAEVHLPVGQAVSVRFKNLNSGPAEIESKPLKIEKLVPGGGEIVVRVKARSPGRTEFVDEYQEDVAKGVFVAE